MIKLKYSYLFIFIIAYWSPIIAQQDIRRLTAFQEPAIINPAFIGSQETTDLLLIGRQQWVGTDGGPNHQLIQLIQPLKNKKAGTGLSLSHYSAGFFKEIDFSLAYSYKIQWTPKISSRIGLQASIKNYNINFADKSIITRRSNDPSIPLGTQINQFKGIFGIGWSLQVDNWLQIGVAMPRLYANDIGVNPAILNTATIDPILLFSIHGRLLGTESLKVYPSLIIRKVDFLPIQTDFNITVALQDLFAFGLGTSGNQGIEAAHFNASYDLAEKWRIGLFYEFPLAKTTQLPLGSFELFLKYQLGISRGDMTNPRFFF